MAHGEDWTEEEILLALDLYLDAPDDQTQPSTNEMRDLADLLGRTVGAVGRKVGNLMAVDPEYEGEGLSHGSSQEEALFRSWAGRQESLRERAMEIRSTLSETLGDDADGGAEGGGDQAASVMDLEEQNLGDLWDRAVERSKSSGGTSASSRSPGSRTRDADRLFRRAVLAAYVIDVGPEAALDCPGCGHGRVKANGKPLLHAHHLIPWSETESMDPRWGTPVCPNCHELLEAGPVREQREIHRKIVDNHPSVLDNLKSLHRDDLLSGDQAERLARKGLEIEL